MVFCLAPEQTETELLSSRPLFVLYVLISLQTFGPLSAVTTMDVLVCVSQHSYAPISRKRLGPRVLGYVCDH